MIPSRLRASFVDPLFVHSTVNTTGAGEEGRVFESRLEIQDPWSDFPGGNRQDSIDDAFDQLGEIELHVGKLH